MHFGDVVRPFHRSTREVSTASPFLHLSMPKQVHSSSSMVLMIMRVEWMMMMMKKRKRKRKRKKKKKKRKKKKNHKSKKHVVQLTDDIDIMGTQVIV